MILVGDETIVGALAKPRPDNVQIVHAGSVVGMDEHPARALVRKKDSSIVVGTELVKNGLADAIVTAGHTGAGMAAGKLILGSTAGIDRPALAVQMTTESGPMVLLDIGANPDSTPENLAQYAHMGAIFAEKVLGVARPRVALLSIGEEKGKGDARIARATQLLDASTLNFVGNVEGRDLPKHLADVVVTDAVAGNVVMKFFEGLSTFIFDLWRTEFSGSWRGRLAALLMRPGIARIRTIFDYETQGGSPLLGVNGIVIITHGSARARMIVFACEVAATMARARVPAAHRRCPRLRSRPGRGRLGWRRRRRGNDPGGHRRGRRPRPGRPAAAGPLVTSGPELTVGRGVIAELVRLAAFEVPGVARVGRGGPAWQAFLAGPPVRVRIRDERVLVRLHVVARPGQALDPLAGQVRTAVAGDRRTLARPGPRRCHGDRRWRRRLTSSADDGRGGDSPWLPCSRPTSASAPPVRSSSVTSPNRNATRRLRRSPGSWSMPSSPIATRSTSGSASSRRSIQ